jgi:hypothetical protein
MQGDTSNILGPLIFAASRGQCIAMCNTVRILVKILIVRIKVVLLTTCLSSNMVNIAHSLLCVTITGTSSVANIFIADC